MSTSPPDPTSATKPKATKEGLKELLMQANQKKLETSKSPSSSNTSSTATTPAVKPKGATVKVSSDLFLRTIAKTQWADIVALITQEIYDSPETYLYSGGQSPIERRIMILENEKVKVSHLKWFVATCEMRGHHIVSFAKKTDTSGVMLAELHAIFKFHGKRDVDPRGNVSVVAFKVAIADIFIAFRQKMGPAVFREKVYEGPCDTRYQWNGGLAAYFHPDEESVKDSEELMLVRLDYIRKYEHYQKWYIDIRSSAAAEQPRAGYIPKTAEKVKESIAKTRSYYRLQLASFSFRTRRAWYHGDFTIEPEKGEPVDETAMNTLIGVLNAEVKKA
jgi:hypothetical protein